MTARARMLVPALLLAAQPAAAASGGEGGGGFPWFQLANLLLLLVVLFVFARKPILGFFADRRARIQEQLDGAARLHADAESRFAEWQRKLAELEAEVRRIQTTARERAEAERATILADAQASAERTRREARAAVEREIQRARESLREEAADLAVELASGMLRERVTDEDRDRLVSEFIERLERTPEAAPDRNGGR